MKGLTHKEAANLLQEHGPNELPAAPQRGLLALVGHQLVDPLTLVLLVAGLLSILVLGDLLEGLAILAIVVLNVILSSVQQFKADAAMVGLRKLTPQMAKVEREGAIHVVKASDVVPGDIVHVAAGDRVPADLKVHSAHSLAADESMLTGESLPVDKASEGHQLFAGTMVVRGRGHGLAHSTGTRTRMGGLAKALDIDTPPPLEAELRRLAWRITAVAGFAAAALLIVVALRSGFTREGLGQAALAAVALAVAAIPEGLLAAVTLALALGAQRMARRGTIVRRMRAIQGLGSADVLCVDKTGTLTEARLQVKASHALPGREADLWQAALRCNDAKQDIGDPLDVALATAAAKAGARLTGNRIAELPFDASTRSMTTLHETERGPIVTVKGAPEAVFARCRGAEEFVAKAHGLAGGGSRVIAFGIAVSKSMDAPLEALGLVELHDPIRPTSAAAIQEARQGGVHVVMVTGDHPETAKAIAAQVGLDGDKLVTGSGLAGLDTTRQQEALTNAEVVARVEPETKVALVRAHQANGRIVVMMGDGINDAPALRAADVGVAVAGSDSTDVAREAADVVLTKGDLSTLIHGVEEGRRVYGNLQSVVSYLIAGNASEVLVVLGGLVLFPELIVPLAAVQLLWLNFLTDGLPAIALGMDDAGPRMRKPMSKDQLLPPRRLLVLVGRGGLMAIAVMLTGLWARSQGWSSGEVQAQLFVSLVVLHLVMAYPSRNAEAAFATGWWHNRVLLAAIVGSIALQAAVFLFAPAREALHLSLLPWSGFAAAIVAAAAVLTVVELVRAGQRRARA